MYRRDDGNAPARSADLMAKGDGNVAVRQRMPTDGSPLSMRTGQGGAGGCCAFRRTGICASGGYAGDTSGERHSRPAKRQVRAA